MSTHEITDAELIRYLDGELESAERSRLDARLAAAPAAAERLNTLRQSSSRIGSILSAADPNDLETQRSARAIRAQMQQARSQRSLHMSPALRAAAVIALLLGFGLAVPPVRAWMIEQVRQLVGDQPAPEALPPANTRSVETPQVAPLDITFAISSDTFSLQYNGLAGELHVWRALGAEAKAEPSANSTANLMIVPNGLRIDGESANATYRLWLPARVTVLVVRSNARAPQYHNLRETGEISVPLR
jgi:hypothetical protein